MSKEALGGGGGHGDDDATDSSLDCFCVCRLVNYQGRDRGGDDPCGISDCDDGGGFEEAVRIFVGGAPLRAEGAGCSVLLLRR
ncbi:hypothetical protein ACWKSP_40110 [Micromonosporaceae bacterium Da 78-11]